MAEGSSDKPSKKRTLAANSEVQGTEPSAQAAAELDLGLLRSKYLRRASGAAARDNLEKAWLTRWAANTFLPAAVDGKKPPVPELPLEQFKELPDGELLQLIAEATPIAAGQHWRDFVASALTKGDYVKAALVLSRLDGVSPADEQIPFLKARLFEERGLAEAAMFEYAKAYDWAPSHQVIPRIAGIILQNGLGRDIVRAMMERASDLKEHPALEACAAGSEIESSVDMLVDAAEKSPSEPWLWLVLARAQRRDGLSDAARASLEKGLNAAVPEDTWMLNAIADDSDALGDGGRAEAALLKASAARKRRAQSFNRFVARQLPSPNVPRPAGLPLLLISQVQRSGGTLLSQLFDGHPEVLAHPDELKIGRPRKWDWPDLDLDAGPESWLRDLLEQGLARFIHHGYSKYSRNTAALEPLPFNFDLAACCRDFLGAVSAVKPRSQREIIDAYFSAYFRAWADCKVDGQERWVTGFVPRLTSYIGSTERFLRDYPDGLIVSCVRNPFDWYISAHRHKAEYGNIRFALELWKTSTLSAIELYARSPQHIHLTVYEMLVADTAGEMGRLAERMRIETHLSLTIPTYLGRPVPPNSSFQIAETGIIRRAKDTRELLSDSEFELIGRDAAPLYRRFVEIVEEGRSSP